MHVLVTCKYKKDRIKRWRHHFPHYKSMGAFCCHGHQGFDSICLKTLCNLSPPPVMLHTKFDQDWPTGLRDIQVRKWKNFCHSRASNSKVSSLIRPEIKLIWAFMPVLVTSNFGDDSIKNERASMETPFSHSRFNLPPNLMQPFPHPSDATHKIWSRLANWLQRYSSSKVWTTTDHWYTISSPGEPLAQVS